MNPKFAKLATIYAMVTFCLACLAAIIYQCCFSHAPALTRAVFSIPPVVLLVFAGAQIRELFNCTDEE